MLLVSDSLRMRDWHNGTAPRIHKMCAERDDCFNSPHHYANAWGSDQGMFTLWCVLGVSVLRGLPRLQPFTRVNTQLTRCPRPPASRWRHAGTP